MKTTKHLFEAASLVSESASENGTWTVKLISEGPGSSGIYTSELLDNHHHAFDGVLSFKNHPMWYEGPQVRDFTMLAGQIVGETWVAEDKTGRKAVFAEYLPDPEYKDKLERYRDKLGLSIYIEGSGYENEDGDFVVDWFNPQDPYASVDVVIAPGARGALTESAGYMESLRSVYEDAQRRDSGKPGTEASVQDKNERKLRMDEETKAEFAALKNTLNGLAETLTVLVADKQAKESQDAQAKADEAAVEERVANVTAALDAVEEAREDLLPSQVESLRAEAKKGADVAPLIEAAKKVKNDALEAIRVTEGAGRDLGDGKTTRFGAWN